MNINIKPVINWTPQEPNPLSNEVVLIGTFHSENKTYQVTVRYNKSSLEGTESANTLDTTIQDSLNRIEAEALAQLAGHSLQTTLEDLKENNEFKIFPGDIQIDDPIVQKKFNETIKTIKQIFSETFIKNEQNQIPRINEPQNLVKVQFEKIKTPLTTQEQKAKALHDGTRFEHGFKTRFCKTNEVKIDKKTGIITCTTEQFKKALRILQQEFPEIECSSTEEKIKRAQLLQLILSGKSTQLKNDTCFILSEKPENPIQPPPLISESQKKKAIELYQQQKFSIFTSKPKINLNTGLIQCSKKQFLEAKKILEQNFTETKYYETPEENIIGAQLLQLIMTGKHTDLKNDKCVALKELENKRTPVVNKDTEGKSFLRNELTSFKEKSPVEESDASHLKRNLVEIVELFEKDCIVRLCCQIFLNGKVIPLGGPQNGSPQFIKIINEDYSAYLKNNTEEVKKIVENNKKSDFYNYLKESELEPLFTNNTEKSIFPEEVMLKLLQPVLINHLPKGENNEIINAFREYALNNIIADKSIESIAQIIAKEKNRDQKTVQNTIEEAWQGNERERFQYLQQILIFSRMNRETINEIANNTKLSVAEVEPLIRMKIFETMILMNQGNISSVPVDLFHLTRKFAAKGSNLYRFSKDFTSMSCTVNSNLCRPAQGDDNFPPQIVEVSTHVFFPTPSAPIETKPTTSVMGEPLFSWKIDENDINDLSQILIHK